MSKKNKNAKLHKLKRRELLELLLIQSKENEELQEKLKKLDKSQLQELADRQFTSVEELENELLNENYKSRYRRMLRSTIYTLITVAACAVLVATLLLPVLQIYGQSMTPSLTDGDIVVSIKGSDYSRGDVIAFYYNNKILVKRVIAFSGEWVDIDDYGNVYIDNEKLDEPYVVELAVGECNIELPYQVPEQKVFVMGDHRATSVDSRSTSVGCVDEEEIVGRIVFRIWPLSRFGKIS